MRRRFINNISVNSVVDWNYLTIEPLEDGVTVETSIENLSYKINGDITWQNFPTHTVSRELKLGESIAFKGRISDNSDNLMGWGRFIVNGRFKLTGDCMSILYDDAAKQIYYLESKHSYCFAYMFVNNTGLEYCDKNFLKATTLASNCYRGMFQGCNNLKYAPELSATTLASECYYKMFENCTSLDCIKMLATDISAYGCLTDWVSGVASKGAFVKNPALTSLTAGSSGIPSGWTVVNNGTQIYFGYNFQNTPTVITYCVADEGMTWGEWVDSEYNTLGWQQMNNLIKYNSYTLTDPASSTLYATDVIKNGNCYLLFSTSGSDD